MPKCLNRKYFTYFKDETIREQIKAKDTERAQGDQVSPIPEAE